MTPDHLPPTLSHLKALSLGSAPDLRELVDRLATSIGLATVHDFDFEQASKTIIGSWNEPTSAGDNAAFLAWYARVRRRPEKYRGELATGFFRVQSLAATAPSDARQLYGEDLKAGDAIRPTLVPYGAESEWTAKCFASGAAADVLEESDEASLLRGTIKALGQIKIYETTSAGGDDDRGVSYASAWRIVDAQRV